MDEFALIEQDRMVDGERRWRTIGFVGASTILFVAHTLEEKGEHEMVRIISARRATPTERRWYGENRKKHIS